MTPDTIRAVPNAPGTTRRTIRIPDEIWLPAQAAADERGENLSEVIRRALIRYTQQRRKPGHGAGG